MTYDTWRSFFYDETYSEANRQGTLRNKLGERDASKLQEVEYGVTALRIHQVLSGEAKLLRTYDAAHLRAIHGYLFGDIYEWAGTYRPLGMGKNPNASYFADPGEIEAYLGEARRLVYRTPWDDLDRSEFVAKSAAVLALINQAHPFREGNGRTQKVFLTQVAEMSRYRLAFEKIEKREWDRASDMSRPDIGSRRVRPAHLYEVLEVATEPRNGPLEPRPRQGMLKAIQDSLERLRERGSSPLLDVHRPGPHTHGIAVTAHPVERVQSVRRGSPGRPGDRLRTQ